MKKIALILALVMLFVFAGCTSTAPAASSAVPASSEAASSVAASSEAASSAAPAAQGAKLDAIKKAGKLVMLTNAAFPPFEYMGNDNKPAGVDVEVAQAIAKDLGVELEIVNMDFDLLIESLKAGKGDLILAGMTIKPERLEQVDFSKEYVKSAQYVIIKSGSGVTADKLDGLTIAVQQDTTGDFYATDDIKAKEVLRFKSGIEAGSALSSGKCDAVIIDKLPAEKIAANSSGKLEVLPKALTEESYAIAVAKENKDLLEAVNASLDKLIADGTVDKLIVKHMEIA
ncbi:ABC transporter substrate-binding protein [Acetanaerobacterium elongatum]|uniref:Amino acid ABC transporter substrate-binding protein, PAAT family n=1 Tax=Acetanaerobacterium elongatum TaxID=258515 RepID=A0A1H0BTM9_9FIRM|nr:ABC transporter substrate-binding protein [Acetanaerobacterium elongatum]SDN48960.1 amino acid ABC transporter substrate-binding protein, PAAT family [Acetanaerobacterium elongatum]